MVSGENTRQVKSTPLVDPLASTLREPQKKYGGLVIVLNLVFGSFGKSLTKNEKLVALAIGHHMRRKHFAFPGVPVLVKETGICRDSVITALRKLCGGEGIFNRQRRGPDHTNLYTLKPSMMSENSDIKEDTGSRRGQSFSAWLDSQPSPVPLFEFGWLTAAPARRRRRRTSLDIPSLLPDLIAQLKANLSPKQGRPPP